jgi:pyruvate/2-oxoglutarate dehydrogenase complex dihydrolipoamide acyltransferase (E2) component
MRVLKQALEAAAAAALATSFFAFPIALAAMDVDLPVSTAPGVPDRVVQIDAAGLLLLSGESAEDEAPPPAPEPADAPEESPDEAPADAPDPAEATPEAAPTPAAPLAVRTPSARRLALRPLKVDGDRVGRKAGAKGRRGKQRKCLEADPRIVDKGSDRFSVDRDLVDAYTSDLKTAAKLAWVGWHRDGEGEIDGFRVKKIRCGSVLHQAGFRNGDVIHAVNGKPVTSIPQALSAYRKLRKKRTLHVEVERKGVVRKMRYRLS